MSDKIGDYKLYDNVKAYSSTLDFQFDGKFSFYVLLDCIFFVSMNVTVDSTITDFMIEFFVCS